MAFGTVIGARPVTVQGGNAPASVVGTIAGGVAGGLLGNQIGGGTGKVIATGVGATAGAAAGNRVANAATTQASTAYTVRTDGGQTVAVIQASPSFGVRRAGPGDLGRRHDPSRRGLSQRKRPPYHA